MFMLCADAHADASAVTATNAYLIFCNAWLILKITHPFCCCIHMCPIHCLAVGQCEEEVCRRLCSAVFVGCKCQVDALG